MTARSIILKEAERGFPLSSLAFADPTDATTKNEFVREYTTLGFKVEMTLRGCVVSWATATEGLALEMKQKALDFHRQHLPVAMASNHLVDKLRYELGYIVDIKIPLFCVEDMEKGLRAEVAHFLQEVQALHPEYTSLIREEYLDKIRDKRNRVTLTFWDHEERIQEKFREVAKCGWYWHLVCSALYRRDELFVEEWGMDSIGGGEFDRLCIGWRLHGPKNEIVKPREGSFGAELFQISTQEQPRIHEEVKRQCAERREEEKKEKEEETRKVATDPSHYLKKIKGVMVWKMQESAPYLHRYGEDLPVETLDETLDGIIVVLKDGRKARVRVTVEWTD